MYLEDCRDCPCYITEDDMVHCKFYGEDIRVNVIPSVFGIAIVANCPLVYMNPENRKRLID